MSITLKPCPFCGHDAPSFERLGTPRQSCIVACGNCGCRHESSDEGADSGKSWNGRSEPAAAKCVFLVATGEVRDGHELYERHEEAPPPLCEFEVLHTSPPPAAAAAAALTEQQAVIEAARQWWCERSADDWSEAELAKAVIRLDGDWAGCPDCDHQCDEPCVPATAEEQIRQLDFHLAHLVHEGKLGRPDGWAPPEGWTPRPARTVRAADPSVLLSTTVDQIDGQQLAETWLMAMVPEGPDRVFWRLERLQFAPHDGGALVLRAHDRIVAAALLVRDDLNRTNTIRIRVQAPPVRTAGAASGAAAEGGAA